jgi:hypothetical protein
MKISRDRPDVEITPEIIEILWANMPGPHEIDTENPKAARKLAAAILRAALDQPRSSETKI